MTTATKQDDAIPGFMATIRINGRRFSFRRIVDVRPVGAGKFDIVTRSNGTFRAEGGRIAGGSAREWYLDGESFGKSIHCTSLVDCCKLIEGM